MERRLLATVYYSTDDDGIPPEEAMSKGTIILFSSYDLTEEELKGLSPDIYITMMTTIITLTMVEFYIRKKAFLWRKT